MLSCWSRAALAGLLFFAAGCPKNQPPEVPAVPVGPAAVVPGEPAEFRLVGRDPEGFSVSFRCSWGDGDTSGWSLWVGAGETATLSYAWPLVGRYEVTAQARDPQEALSGWSEPLEVLVGNPPRRPTRPDGPFAGWIDTTYSYTTVSTDLDFDDIRYVFDWGDGVAETTDFLETGAYVTLEHTWTEPDTYALAVRAIDRAGLPSPWSETLRVSVRDIAGPGIPLWRVELGAGVEVTGVPALDNGRVLFGATDGVLRCLDTSGSDLWSFVTGGPIWSSPAVAADGSVVFGSEDGKVYCLTAAGTKRWEFATQGEVRSSPAIAGDGAILVGSDDGRVYCLEPGGSLRWEYVTGGPVRSSPALKPDGGCFFGSGDSFVYALDAEGGLAWRYRTGGPVDASPAIGREGAVHVSSRDGWCYALQPDGELSWREEVGAGSVSSPAVASDGSIFVGAEAGRVVALYPTGGPVWELAMPGPVRSSPLVDSELNVYFGSGRRLYAVDSRGAGSIAWDLTLPGFVSASVAVSEDGVIYIGDAAGNFWAVRGSAGLDSGAWPKFRHDARNTGRAEGGGR